MKKENYKWSENDVDFLKNNIGTLTFKGIAKRLGRTETAVIDKAKRLKLGTFESNSGLCSVKCACEILGVSRCTIFRNVKNGKLKIVRKNVRNGTYRMFLKYDEVDEFKKSYKKQNHKKWSPYEQSLLELYLLQGMPDKEISEKLCRSVQSIRHRKRVIKCSQSEKELQSSEKKGA